MDASQKITDYIASKDDWRGQMLTQLRHLILSSDSNLSEDWKWNVPVWTSAGMPICAVSGFKDHVKLNMFRGAELDDPDELFNAGLEAKGSRSIDFHEGDALNEPGISALIKAASKLH